MVSIMQISRRRWSVSELLLFCFPWSSCCVFVLRKSYIEEVLSSSNNSNSSEKQSQDHNTINKEKIQYTGLLTSMEDGAGPKHDLIVAFPNNNSSWSCSCTWTKTNALLSAFTIFVFFGIYVLFEKNMMSGLNMFLCDTINCSSYDTWNNSI